MSVAIWVLISDCSETAGTLERELAARRVREVRREGNGASFATWGLSTVVVLGEQRVRNACTRRTVTELLYVLDAQWRNEYQVAVWSLGFPWSRFQVHPLEPSSTRN